MLIDVVSYCRCLIVMIVAVQWVPVGVGPKDDWLAWTKGPAQIL
jgi:hypothetical protein